MEDEVKNDSIVSKVRLKDADNRGEFKPFVVNYQSNPILKHIIDAFNSSNEVKLGYSTIQKGKGIVEPTMKRKNLYLTGGALRDHLKNKTFTSYDLTTEASPDEIRKILELPVADLEEVQPPTHDLQILQKYKRLPSYGSRKRSFYASRWDEDGHEVEVTVEINGQKAHIAPFSFNSKERMVSPKKRNFATTLEEDSTTRDLTINSLYLKLKNEDGENSELLDPQGGVFDLKNGKIHLIMSEDKTFKRYPYLGFRICSLSARYAHDKSIPENLVKPIQNDTPDNLDDKIIKRLYMMAIDNQDTPTYYYIQNLMKCDLIKKIFGNLNIHNPDMSMPSNKIISTAYLLQNNHPENVLNTLVSKGWSKLDAENIANLVRLARFATTVPMNPDLIYDYFTKPNHLSSNQIKMFLRLMGEEGLYDNLLPEKYSDVLKKYIEEDGVRKVNPKLIAHYGRTLRTDEMEDARRNLFRHRTLQVFDSPLLNPM